MSGALSPLRGGGKPHWVLPRKPSCLLIRQTNQVHTRYYIDAVTGIQHCRLINHPMCQLPSTQAAPMILQRNRAIRIRVTQPSSYKGECIFLNLQCWLLLGCPTHYSLGILGRRYVTWNIFVCCRLASDLTPFSHRLPADPSQEGKPRTDDGAVPWTIRSGFSAEVWNPSRSALRKVELFKLVNNFHQYWRPQ